MIDTHVAGGTNAGVKRPPAEPAQPWAHLCKAHPAKGGVILSGNFRNCPACYCRRPEVAR